MANNILTFCGTDTGTNLLTQAEYLAASDRTSGNKPGIASAKLVNKAIRQAAYISSQMAQYISDRLGVDVLDDNNTTTLLANIKRAYSGTIVDIAAKTTTYSSLNTDGVILLSASGGAFTVTLFTAVGNAGKILEFKKTDSTLNVITIDGAGSETIDGNLTTTLNTQYEAIRMISDGTSWFVLDRRIPANRVAWTPTFVGLGTVTNIECYSSRSGPYLCTDYKFTAGTCTAVELQLGMGINGVNGGLLSDAFPSIRNVSDGASAWNTTVSAISGGDSIMALSEPSTAYLTLALPANGTRGGFAKINGNTLNDNTTYAIKARVPITGWNSR